MTSSIDLSGSGFLPENHADEDSFVQQDEDVPMEEIDNGTVDVVQNVSDLFGHNENISPNESMAAAAQCMTINSLTEGKKLKISQKKIIFIMKCVFHEVWYYHKCF